MNIQQILDQQFRANPAYQLVAYDRLAAEEQAQLGQLAEDANFYGVLLKENEVKAVDPETALLLMTLREPGTIPTYVRHQFAHKTNHAIVQLVLDDLLQIQVEDAFLSGAAAHAIVYQKDANRSSATHPLASLAHDALQYAQALPTATPEQLAQRLYLYNIIPFSAQWQRQLSSETAVKSWLGINGWLDQAWHQLAAESLPGWRGWRHRQATVGTLPYKLYVSPTPDQLPTVFRPIVDIFAKHRVATFKIGKDAHGILRPDKMVAYFPNFEQLAAVSQALQSELTGCHAQGVPFTAPIDADGLLSWGMDPPAEAQIFAGETRESWRFWICQQLATALITAQTDNQTIQPWQFALDRLHVSGVDTQRWLPAQSIWKKQTA